MENKKQCFSPLEVIPVCLNRHLTLGNADLVCTEPMAWLSAGMIGPLSNDRLDPLAEGVMGSEGQALLQTASRSKS